MDSYLSFFGTPTRYCSCVYTTSQNISFLPFDLVFPARRAGFQSASFAPISALFLSVERVGWQPSDKPNYIILCPINNCQVNNLYIQ